MKAVSPLSCSLHTLPYTADIESVFVQALTSYSSLHCPVALLDLHEALRAWWDVRCDCDEWVCAPIVRELLAAVTGGTVDGMCVSGHPLKL